MISVTTENHVATLINVFTVDPANRRQRVDLLAQATADSVRRMPGFVSASPPRSVDGTKVAMSAQWRRIEACHAMRHNNDAAHHFEKALALAKFEPGMYEVGETLESVAKDAPNI